MTRDAIVSRLADALDGCPPETLDLFDALFRSDPPIRTAKALAARLGAGYGTMSSRFTRAGLPSPKEYVAAAILIRAALLLQDSRRSISSVAYALGWNDQAPFFAFITRWTGLSGVAFRMRWDGTTQFDDFVASMVTAHIAALRRTTLVGPKRFVPVAA